MINIYIALLLWYIVEKKVIERSSKETFLKTENEGTSVYSTVIWGFHFQ